MAIAKILFYGDRGDYTNTLFQETIGLNIEAKQIECRHGNCPVFSEINMPGIVKNSNIKFKKRVFANDDRFWDW